MDTNQVSEHLQVIRTLMERSALYRRALAPIMIYCGILGIIGGIVGWFAKFNSNIAFVLYWNGVAVLALIGAFILVRRQALKEREPFWSPPTKRVTQAILPPLVLGMFAGLLWIKAIGPANDPAEQVVLILIWTALYGCALHSAGFVISGGFRLFGWIFVSATCVLLIGLTLFIFADDYGLSPHLLMSSLFGGLHLLYGIYLYFTESKKSSS